jgi:tyrosyl-tRNA synthetase
LKYNRLRKGFSVHTDVLDELAWRGLIASSTDLDALRAELAAGPVAVYCGFDPTAPSLHMGNLLQILTLRRLQEAGNPPVGVVGGATGMIGDPKQSGERRLNTVDVVKTWTEAIRRQLERFLSFEGDAAATVVNNYDWTASLSTLDFLRDIGKHFPVNRMLARDVVRSRLDSGISYTEFSYVLLQSMDYLNLFRDYGVRLQTGGSDQWGNLTAGVELVRRVEGARVHALATPLVTKADGTKFGKTETDTLWLDADMTSPYAFHQFWLNTDDRDVVSLLKYFTFLDREHIKSLEREVAERPAKRAAQRALADDVTTTTHGAQQTERVKSASAALFGSGDLRGLDAATLDAALLAAPHIEVDAHSLPTFTDLLTETALASSRSAARRTIGEGGAYLNNARIADPDARPEAASALAGGWLVLRRGRRSLAGVRCR